MPKRPAMAYSTADTTEVETTLAAALTQLEALEMDSLIHFAGTEIRVAIEALEIRRRFTENLHRAGNRTRAGD